MESSCVVAIGAAILASLSLVSEARIETASESYTFPEDFKFGVSTSSYQIEGAWDEDGKGASVWDVYLHKHPNFTADRLNGDVAADSYHKYKTDVEMIRKLGVGYYRMSISWPRILPQGTDNHIIKAGVQYYNNLFDELLKYNITPMVTLYHWDLPQPLMDLGGFTNPFIVDYFVDYARVAFSLFGDKVKIWTTINEPHQHCYNGYGNAVFAPALESHGTGEYLCSHYILLAHARAYHLYDKEFRPTQKGRIGITLDSFWSEPKNASDPGSVEAAERYVQMHLGLYAHPIFSEKGDYPADVKERVDQMSSHQHFSRSRLPKFTPEEVKLLRGSSDFFGLNHYTTFLAMPSLMDKSWRVPSMNHDTGVVLSQPKTWPKPGAPWLGVYPPGFRRNINWITEKYGTSVPIIVTENGCSDHGGIEDYARVSYFNTYLSQLLLAMYEDGANVEGYFAWTLMDDFEWNDGYVTKFGLFQVDFDSPNKERIAKFSAVNYREIVRTRKINYNFIRNPDESLSGNDLFGLVLS